MMHLLNKLIFTLVILCLVDKSNAQTVTQLVAINANGTENDIRAVHDAEDNLFIGGYRVIQGVMNQDGPGNLFIRKYTPQGNLLWSIGSEYTNQQYTAQLTDMDADMYGNLYLIGTYNTTTITIAGVTYSDPGNAGSGHNVFAAKINADGTVQWITGFMENIYPANICVSNTITVTTDQHILLTGAYFKDIVIGNDTLPGDPMAPNGGQAPNFFLAKYNPSGTPVWAKRWKPIIDADLMTYGGIIQVAAGETNQLFLAISSESGIVTTTDTIGQNSSLSIVKLDSDGNLLIETPVFSPHADITGMTTDACGNVAITGSFIDSVNAGFLTAVHSSVPEDHDIYVARFDEELNPLWISRLGSTGGDNAGSISCNDRNAIFINYEFWGTVDSPVPFTPSPSGYLDLAIVKLDSNGVIEWWQHTAGPGHAQRGELSVASDNTIVSSGRYMGTEHFGGTTITSIGNNTLDVFFVRMTDSILGTYPSNCSSLSIEEELSGNLKLVVYPNPVTEILNIRLPENTPKTTRIIIRSLTGQIVYSDLVKDQLSLSNLAAGTYFLEIPAVSPNAVLFMKQ